MFKVNNKDSRTMPLAPFGVFIVKFEYIFTPCSSVSIVNFEQVNAGWETDGCLHLIKWFSTNSRIEQAFITQTFLETRNWKILSPKWPTRLITCLESVYRKRSKKKGSCFFFSWLLRVVERFVRPGTRCAVGRYVQGV